MTTKNIRAVCAGTALTLLVALPAQASTATTSSADTKAKTALKTGLQYSTLYRFSRNGSYTGFNHPGPLRLDAKELILLGPAAATTPTNSGLTISSASPLTSQRNTVGQATADPHRLFVAVHVASKSTEDVVICSIPRRGTGAFCVYNNPTATNANGDQTGILNYGRVRSGIKRATLAKVAAGTFNHGLQIKRTTKTASLVLTRSPSS